MFSLHFSIATLFPFFTFIFRDFRGVFFLESWSWNEVHPDLNRVVKWTIFVSKRVTAGLPKFPLSPPSPRCPREYPDSFPGSFSYSLRWVGDGLPWWTTNGLPRIPIWDILKGGECSQARRNQFESERVRKKISPSKIFFKTKRGIQYFRW